MSSPNRSYATFEDWSKGLVFGPYVEDETVLQVRAIAKSAFEAGRQSATVDEFCDEPGRCWLRDHKGK